MSNPMDLMDGSLLKAISHYYKGDLELRRDNSVTFLQIHTTKRLESRTFVRVFCDSDNPLVRIISENLHEMQLVFFGNLEVSFLKTFTRCNSRSPHRRWRADLLTVVGEPISSPSLASRSPYHHWRTDHLAFAVTSHYMIIPLLLPHRHSFGRSEFYHNLLADSDSGQILPALRCSKPKTHSNHFRLSTFRFLSKGQSYGDTPDAHKFVFNLGM
ncbi:hypothetical protein LguiA_029971 [Lonicera macranthoides]